MNPAFSSRLTRVRHGLAESPTASASSTLLMRPRFCNSVRMRKSSRSSVQSVFIFPLLRPVRLDPGERLRVLVNMDSNPTLEYDDLAVPTRCSAPGILHSRSCRKSPEKRFEFLF